MANTPIPIPPPQPTPPQAVSVNGQNYSASRLVNVVTFTSVPPAAAVQPGASINCNLQGANMTCGQGNSSENLFNCQTSVINGGSQIVCQADPNAPVKIFAQVPITPITPINFSNSWLWIVIILIIVYLLFVLCKKR